MDLASLLQYAATQLRVIAVARAAMAGLAACSSPHPDAAPPIAFENVHVVSMTGAGMLNDHVVVVRNGAIESVEPRRTAAIPADAMRIDGHGGYLLPGLTDAHTHLYDTNGFASYLAYGVTTVFNLNGTSSVLGWRDSIARGDMVGPTIFTAGQSVDGDPPVNFTFVAAGSPEDARTIAAAQRHAGYDFIKVYHLIDRDVYLALAAAAKREGLAVVGHIPRSTGVDLALRAGQAMVAHAEEFFREPVDENRMRAMARLADSAKVAITPNLFVFSDLIDAATDPRRILGDPEVAYASPAAYMEKLPANRRGGTNPNPTEVVASLRVDIARFGRFAAIADSAGVPLLIGTDTEIYGFAGSSLHDEMAALVAAGLSPARVLRAATRNAGEFVARHVRSAPRFGQVARGHRADLMLVALNPLDGLETLRQPLGVMARGRWHSAEALRRARDSVAAAYVTVKRALSQFDSLVATRHGSAALDTLRRLRATHPNDVLMPANVLAAYGQRLAASVPSAPLELARIATDLWPTSSAAHAHAAAVLRAANNDADALEHLHRAVALAPYDAYLRNRLARFEAGRSPGASSVAGAYMLRIDDMQVTGYAAPAVRAATLRIVPAETGFTATLERRGVPVSTAVTVISDAGQLWADFAPTGERPIELRLTVSGSTVSGYWVQGVARRWRLTGSRESHSHNGGSSAGASRTSSAQGVRAGAGSHCAIEPQNSPELWD